MIFGRMKVVVVHECYDKCISTLAWGSLPVPAQVDSYLSLPTDPLCQLTLLHLGITSGSYRYMPQLSELDHPPPPLSHPIQWPNCPSPVHAQRLAYLLRFHPDREFTSFVLRGLVEGFHLGYMPQQSRLRSSHRNYPSSLANPQVVLQYVQGELASGRMVGPLHSGLLGLTHCSPIGLVPKGRGTDQWRMIVDLSYPSGASVNDGVSPSLCSLKYVSLDDAIHLINMLGPGTLLVKIDLKSAYRFVPIHPLDRHLLGIRWQEQVFVDQALPFGLRSAPKLFTAVADAIGWALFQMGIRLQIHYLDDYLFFIHPSSSDAYSLLPSVLNTLDHLGVPVATQKIEVPATTVTFLGVIVDTVRLELRLPDHKLEYIRSLVRWWRWKRTGHHKEFESLLGHLSHAATVIRQGRVFLQNLYRNLESSRSRPHFVHLDSMARADLIWWSCFLQRWNGFMFFPQRYTASVDVFTDASGSFGCGGVLMSSQ